MMRFIKTVLCAATSLALGVAPAIAQMAPPATPSPAGPATTEEVEGQIANVDPAGTKIQLADGTVLMIPTTVQVRRGDVKEGSRVKASYEERGDQKVVTSLQIEPTTQQPAEGKTPAK